VNVAPVTSRAEVNSHRPYQHWKSLGFSRRAVITRLPWPSCAELLVEFV
jgi:hypothetical protein